MSPRAYTQGRRAQSVAATRRRILDATLELSSRRFISDISLDDVARESDVSVQTVLRQFGSRAGLIEAVVSYADEVVRDERRATPGDLPAAVEVLVAHYEHRGDTTLLLLAQEHTDPTLRRVADSGRALHREWVLETLVGHAPGGREPDAALVDLLAVATDVYTWKLLRRDRGLERDTTVERMLRLVNAVLRSDTREED